MKERLFALATLALLSFSNPAWASGAKWTLLGTIGFADPTYPLAIQTAVDSARSTAGTKRTPLTATLGLFFPSPWQQTLWGASLEGITDLYSTSEASSKISQFALCGSILKFVGDRPKTGPFAAMNVGLAMANAVNSAGRSANSGFGPSLGGFFGYSADLFHSGKMLMIVAGYSLNLIEGETYRSASLRAGLLF